MSRGKSKPMDPKGHIVELENGLFLFVSLDSGALTAIQSDPQDRFILISS